MTDAPRAGARRARSGAALGVLALSAALLVAPACGQPRGGAGSAHAGAGAEPAQEQGPRWSELTAAQRDALQPLEREWPTLDAVRKQKWLRVARRFPRLPPQERERIQARMSPWSKLTPQQRTRARLRYEQSLKLPPQERQARWEAWQALPPEERREFAAQAAKSAGHRPPPPSKRTLWPDRAAAVPTAGAAAPFAVYHEPPQPVTPAVLQIRPGATTRLISGPRAPARAAPVLTVDPERIDPHTLLPLRGAQAGEGMPAPQPPGIGRTPTPER